MCIYFDNIEYTNLCGVRIHVHICLFDVRMEVLLYNSG